jgi:phytoene synthase
MSTATNSAVNSPTSSRDELTKSYDWCENVARSQAKNFYYSFVLLPSAKRKAMCAIYAFMRYCDDLSDDEGVADRAASIAQWRNDLEAALVGNTSARTATSGAAGSAVWPAFIDTVNRFKIPHQYFFDMIDGVTSDLEPRRVQTFDELYAYCYRVASVVGLTIIHIFEFSDPKALELAERCGIAFQITNILRDVKEDSEKQRVYLPAEDLQRFGVSSATFTPPEAFRKLMAFEAGRARQYFQESRPLIAMVQWRSRASLEALIAIYSRLLDKIVASRYDVLSQRIRLSTATKLWLLVRSARAQIGFVLVLVLGVFAILLGVLHR